MGTSDDDSPSPPTPRGHRRRTRSPSPRGRNGGHGRPPRTSLMVRNLGPYCRPNDLRGPFGRFGDLKGVYLPKDYYTREPRGFGFVEYFDPENASNAKSHMDGQKFLGREINVVFARYSRSTPSAMRAIERSGGGPSCDRRLRSRSPGYHDSPRGRSWSRSRSYSPAPKRKHYSRSPSPRPRERSSPADSRSKSASPGASRSKSASPAENNMGTSDDDSPSPPRGHRRRTRSPSPPGRYRGHGRPPRTSLMVRNLGPYCRRYDLRRPFERFGRVKDIYLPKDYYTREPRGFGFVEYFDPEDASRAKSHMDGQILLGREINVGFARHCRSTPSAMRAIERSGGGPSCDRRSRSRSPGYHDSPRGRSRSRSRSYSPAQHYSYSRSPSPRAPERSSPADSRSKSASPGASRSPPRQRSPSVSE